MLTRGVHWSEAGSDAAQTDAPAGPERLLERHRRIAFVNRVVSFHGCTLKDWNNDRYILMSLRGRTEVVDSLQQGWARAEEMSKKPADPLDPDFLAALSKDG